MERTFAAVDRVIEAAGELWLYALVLCFIAIALESAKPKPADDAPKSEGPGFLSVMLAIVNLATPLLLFWRGFGVAQVETARPIYIVIILVAGAVLLGALLGWTIAAAAPGIGRAVTRAAPAVAIVAFALAFYVAFPDVFAA